MTIYTPSQGDKDKETLVPEVVTEPLTSFKDDQEEEVDPVPKTVRVTVFPHRRRTFMIHMLITIMVLVILACGTIGAVVFYRHLNKKVYSGKCGTVYFDTVYHTSDPAKAVAEPQNQFDGGQEVMDFVEEDIVVSEVDKYERAKIPQFDEVSESFVWHDFNSNYSAIVERQLNHCFVLKLNRSAIAPPKDVIDLLEKLMSGYYMPPAIVSREHYRALTPPVKNLAQFGKQIAMYCSQYTTYMLEKEVSGVFKRSVDKVQEVRERVYAYMSNKKGHQVIHKVFIQMSSETLDS